MKALFEVDTPHEQNLPPVESLHYTEPGAPDLRGGWWVSDGVPPGAGTVLVTIESSEEVLESMRSAGGACRYVSALPD